MSQSEPVVTISRITDDDSGMYFINEIDFGLHLGAIDKVFRSRGLEGKKDILLLALAHMQYAITSMWDEFERKNGTQAQTFAAQAAPQEKP